MTHNTTETRIIETDAQTATDRIIGMCYSIARWDESDYTDTDMISLVCKNLHYPGGI